VYEVIQALEKRLDFTQQASNILTTADVTRSFAQEPPAGVVFSDVLRGFSGASGFALEEGDEEPRA
jgi:hypothetical protein